MVSEKNGTTSGKDLGLSNITWALTFALLKVSTSFYSLTDCLFVFLDGQAKKKMATGLTFA